MSFTNFPFFIISSAEDSDITTWIFDPVFFIYLQKVANYGIGPPQIFGSESGRPPMGHGRELRRFPGDRSGDELSPKKPSLKICVHGRQRQGSGRISAPVYHRGERQVLNFMDNLIEKKFFSKDRPVFKVNIHEDIVALYNEAITAAVKQKSGFQQLLAGIVGRLLSLAYFYDRNSQFEESDTAKKISQAKVMIQDSFADISPEDIASRLCISYSSFRKTFKEYTGFSPARYISEVRMGKAKELLTNTSLSIKEVAYRVGYNNHDYFFTAFRHMTGRTPAEYRAMTQGTKV